MRAAVRRPKKQRHLRKRFEGPIRLSLFAGGLLVGALLAGPALPRGSAKKVIDAVAVGAPRTPPTTATDVVAIRDEHGTAGSEPVPPAVEGTSAEPTHREVNDRVEGGSAGRAVQKAPSGYRGTLIVTSTPRGASVFINGELKGQTPLELHGQPAGSGALRLDLDGYDRWSRAINVVANDATIVSARLNRVD